MDNSNRKKKNLYEREANLLSEVRSVSEDEKLSKADYQNKLKEFCDNYEDLLDQCKLITKVSDRLQNKINTANEKLEENNVELQNTVDALTKAKIGRRATTYVLFITIALFIIIEWKIEPYIETWAENHEDWSPENQFLIGLAIKGVLVLLLKPIEMITERTLMKKAQQQSEKERKLAARRAVN